jgi:hypothetical protein
MGSVEKLIGIMSEIPLDSEPPNIHITFPLMFVSGYMRAFLKPVHINA